MPTYREIMDAAWGLYRAGDPPGAERAYERAVEAEPSAAEAWYLLGAMRQVQAKFAEAEDATRRALQFRPDHADALSNLGLLLLTRGEPAEAVSCFREVLRLRPDHADALSNLGNAFQSLGEPEQSLDCYRRAIQFKPDHIDAHICLGNAMQSLGRLPEAIACHDAAVRLAPGHPQAHAFRALARLLTGDFERGWAEHEWRLKCPGYAIPPIPRPLWDGAPLKDRPILLYADHGLGDALQFVRYAREVGRRGGRPVVACVKPLERILATCPGVWKVAPEGTAVPEFDAYIPLMSLPRIFGTTLATIPAEVPYLTPEADLVARWQAKLASMVDAGDVKVGVAWQGNPEHGKDRERSFPLARLEPLARVPGVRLISLQQGAGTEQIATLDGRFQVVDLRTRFEDLMETAALMKGLDLVIAPDTSLIHLAGAIGAPAWLALPFAPDWRWLLDRDDSPWYPSIRLFRQRRRRRPSDRVRTVVGVGHCAGSRRSVDAPPHACCAAATEAGSMLRFIRSRLCGS